MAFNPMLSEVDTRASEFVTRGVADTTTASAIEAVGGIATKAHEGYRQAKLEDEVSAEIQQFFDRAAAKSTGISGEQVGMLAEQTAGLVSTPEEDAALRTAIKDYSRLASAVSQGAMDSTHLKARVEAITKAHINRMPGMADMFREAAAQTLGDYSSRIKWMEDTQAAQSEAQAKAQDDFRKKAIELEVDVWTQPAERWQTQTLDIMNSMRLTDEAKRARDRRVIDVEYTLDKQGGALHQGYMLEFRTEAKGILDSDASTVDKQTALKALSNKYMADINRWNPEGKDDARVKTMRDSITDLTSVYIDTASGKLTADEAANRFNTAMDTNAVYALSNPALSAYATTRKLVGDELTSLVARNVKLDGMVEFINNSINGDYPFPGRPGDRTAEGRAKVRDGFNGLSSLISRSVKEDLSKEEVTPFVTMIQSTVDNWKSGEGAEAFDGLMRVTANPDFMTFASKYLDSNTLNEITARTNDFILKSVATGFGGEYNPKTMRLGVRENGEIYVASGSGDRKVQDAVRNINSKYMGRFSSYVQGMTHMQGSTNYKDAAEKLSEVLDRTARGEASVEVDGKKKLLAFVPTPKGQEDQYIGLWELNEQYNPLFMIGRGIGALGGSIVYGPQGGNNE